MESPTKNRQTVETIEALVDAAYGARQVPKADGSIVELKRGRFNAVYRVRLRDGRDVALKIAPSPEVNVLTYEQRLMANELAAIELIARRSAAPVPHVEHIFDGAGPVGAPCFFMAFVDGENLGELLEHGEKADAPRLDHLMTELGRVNRVLNGIRGSSFGYVGDPVFSDWPQAFRRMVEDVLADGHRAQVRLEDIEERAAAALDLHSDALRAVTSPVLVSWDLWPGNAIVTKSMLVGVVDHERSLWGDPLMEAGFMNPNIPIFPREQAFARGYGVVQGDESGRARKALYALHRLLIMAVEPSYRGHQDPRQEVWSLERIRGLLTSLGV